MDFTYNKMWNWYTNAQDTAAFPATDDVVVRIYNADYSAMKYRAETMAPFTNPSVTVSRILDESILAAGTTARHGLFLVSDATNTEEARKRALSKKNLFFVFPSERKDGSPDGTGATRLMADHFSFCHDKNDKNTPVHFHLTEYMPHSLIAGRGSTFHMNNYLPSVFVLPATAHAFRESHILQKDFDVYSALVYAILARPTPQQPQNGGTTNRRRKRRARARQPGPLSFESAWFALPLHKLIVMAVKNASGAYDVTLVMYDRLTGVKSERSRQSCALPGVPRDVVLNAAALEERIATRFLSTLTWDDFALRDE